MYLQLESVWEAQGKKVTKGKADRRVSDVYVHGDLEMNNLALRQI